MLGSVVIEAAVLGVLASLLGLAAGLGVATGLTSLFATIGLEFPSIGLVVEPSTVIVSLLAGVIVTVGAAVVPARRAATVAPVEAMRDASIERVGTSGRRLLTGAALAVAGGAALAAGVVQGSAALVGLGAVAAFHASIALGPVLVRPVTTILALPLRRLGVSGRLAAANAMRNPKRSAATAAALTIGVMLVAGASMFASTARATILGDVGEVVVAERVVRPVGSNPGVPTDVATTLDSIDGVTAVALQVTTARIDGEVGDLAGVDLAGTDDVLALELLEGSLQTGDTSIVVGDQVAEDRGWTVGAVVELAFTDGDVRQVEVVGIVDQTVAFPAVFAGYATVAEHGEGLDRLVLVDAPADSLPAVEAALAGSPTVVVDTVADYAASLAGALDMILTLVIGFLGLAVVIAVLGIATTIGLSVHERTRELGMLRAVGMSRRQLRRSIRLESIVIALFGTLLGMAMGVGFTWAVLTTLDEQGFAAPVVPSGTLVGITVGALVAGTLAAALPARRASRLAVLDAVRTD